MIDSLNRNSLVVEADSSHKLQLVSGLIQCWLDRLDY